MFICYWLGAFMEKWFIFEKRKINSLFLIEHVQDIMHENELLFYILLFKPVRHQKITAKVYVSK